MPTLENCPWSRKPLDYPGDHTDLKIPPSYLAKFGANAIYKKKKRKKACRFEILTQFFSIFLGEQQYCQRKAEPSVLKKTISEVVHYFNKSYVRRQRCL